MLASEQSQDASAASTSASSAPHSSSNEGFDPASYEGALTLASTIDELWPLQLVNLKDRDQMLVLYKLLHRLPHVLSHYLDSFIFPETCAHQGLKLSACGQVKYIEPTHNYADLCVVHPLYLSTSSKCFIPTCFEVLFRFPDPIVVLLDMDHNHRRNWEATSSSTADSASAAPPPTCSL